MVWWQSLIGPALPVIVVALFLIVVLLRPFRSRRQRQRETDATQASRLGMTYLPPGGTGVPGPIDEGCHRFSGHTSDIDWTVETMLLADQAGQTDNETAHDHSARSYSRWTSRVEASDWRRGAYLLLISRSAETSQPEFRSELLDGLVKQMATLALILRVRAYFGEARGSSLVLSPDHRRSLDDATLDSLYTVFSDAPERLSRLNPATLDWLLEARELGLAVLWDDAGLAVSCPVDQVEPLAVARLAKQAARLSGLR